MLPIRNLFGIEPYTEDQFNEEIAKYYPGTLGQSNLMKLAKERLDDVNIQALLHNTFGSGFIFHQTLQEPEEAQCLKEPLGPNHINIATLEDIFCHLKIDGFEQSKDFDIASVYTKPNQQGLEFRGMYGKYWGSRTVIAASYDTPGTRILFQSTFPKEFSDITRNGNPLAGGPFNSLFPAYRRKFGQVVIPLPDLVEVGSLSENISYTPEGIKSFDYAEEEIFRI